MYDGFHDLGEFDWKSGLIEAIVMIRIKPFSAEMKNVFKKDVRISNTNYELELCSFDFDMRCSYMCSHLALFGLEGKSRWTKAFSWKAQSS